MPHPVIDAASAYRARLLAQEREAATQLIIAYARAYAALDAEREALIQFLSAAGLTGITQANATRLAVVQSLIRQISAEVTRYGAYADGQIARAVQDSIILGQQGAQAMVTAYGAGNAAMASAIGAAWDVLPAEAIETAIGFTGPGSPLANRLTDTLGDAVAQRVGTVLVDAIATGTNPRVIGQLLQREFGLGLTWSLTTARTAQLWTYREATRQSYLANRDVVSGWKWWSALDSRTCVSCLAQHGRVYPLEETLNDHHNGRCSMLPIVPMARRLGIQPLPTTTGEDWFRAQPSAAQQQQMGPGLWQAWQDGAVSFDQLSVPYTDTVYGDMMRVPTLNELLGEDAATYTARARERR